VFNRGAGGRSGTDMWGAAIKGQARAGRRPGRFTDTIDRLIVQTAAETTDRLIVSEDSDLWDPTDKEAKGKPHTPVARILLEFEDIRVMTLGKLMAEVHPRIHR